ncbi:MAG: T9SS type A sorting domain-containing protein, partial [Flavobacterium sp.]|nr:T9SS type A sorting domain-containing protein [Flavobacterium sp.]
ATLTIEPGVIIRSSAAGAGLFVTKGAKLIAEGTAANPIVFTSANSEGNRNRGDWGGVILLGNGAYNINSGVNNIEGITASADTQFGGGATPDDNDNSGSLKYVRIEFAGYTYGAAGSNTEINGLTFGAVGRGTTIDYVQVSYANDDSFEWFGGAVNCKHLVAYRGLDDDFDTDNGFSGSVQFALAIKEPAVADTSDSNCFESDNNSTSANGTKFTTGIFSNCTLVGPTYRTTLPSGGTLAIRHRRGAHLRRNTELQVFNSIFMDFVDGLVVDGNTTTTNATNNALKFKNNIIAGTAAAKVAVKVESPTTAFDIAAWFTSNSNTSQTASAGLLTLPYNTADGSIYTGLDYRPATGSIALTGADFTDASFTGTLQTTYYIDVDGDGYDSGTAVLTVATPPTGYSYTTLGSDCDDTNAAIQINCPTITKVAYRGAFAPAPIPMWTDTWTEYDPQNKVYPTPTVTISANITTNTTWTAGNTYSLGGQIYVKNNATLTIEPGVIIRSSAAGAGLFVTKGAKLIAEGTAANPIVFTSANSEGNRNRGDWGGVILLGNGAYNINSGVNNIEGITASADTQFGGGATPDDNDNSGSLKYVRIEFAGYTYGAAGSNTEINGLTFGAVGRGTTIDYVQVSYANDDSFEWFGGAVNCKHLVAYRGLDDDFDTDNGFSGSVQFALAIKEPAVADTSDSNCFESDNNSTSANGTKFTTGIFSNCTLVGPTYRTTLPSGGTLAIRHRRGAHLRRNTELQVFNSIFMDFVDGLVVDGNTTTTNATNNALKFKNNIIAGTTAAKVAVKIESPTTAFDIATWFTSNSNTSQTASAGLLTLPYNTADGSIYTGLDYRPATGSIALTGADFTDSSLGAKDFTAAISEFYLSLYPNPYTNTFKLNYISNNDETVKVAIYDLTGKLLETRTVEYADINNQEMGNGYVPGIYIVVLKQADISKSVRVIKK